MYRSSSTPRSMTCGNTAEAYATGYFDQLGFDAVTFNPYLGADSLAPFLERPGRGVLILCRTSNPSAGELQDIAVSPDASDQGDESLPLYQRVAHQIATWVAPVRCCGRVRRGDGRDLPARTRGRARHPAPRAAPDPRRWRTGRRGRGGRAREHRRRRIWVDHQLQPQRDLRVVRRRLRHRRPQRRAGPASGD